MTSTAREIARAITAWNADLGQLARSTTPQAIDEAIASYEQALIPMQSRTAAERLPDQQQLAKFIGSIGARIRPDFSEAQAQLWIQGMVDALDHLPARIALQSAREARHIPIEFPGQVLGKILEIAEKHLATHRARIARLKRLRTIAEQSPAIEASPEAKDLASQQELRAMSPELAKLGIAGGWLVEDETGIRWATDDEQAAHTARKADQRRIARARAGKDRA